jgi:RNA polymerase sigma factor (sigma-70 family)
MSDADNRLPPNGDSRTEIHRRVGLAAEVFGKYSSEIRAMIGFNVKDKSKAEDLFQNFFISLVRNPIPPHISDIKAYLYRAVTNDVHDVFRRTKIHQESVEKYVEARKYDTVREDPQGRIIEAEETREMFRLIECRLPKRQATVVTHRYEKGLSAKDTAERMCVDKRSVYRYLSAAKKKLREFIPEKGGHFR